MQIVRRVSVTVQKTMTSLAQRVGDSCGIIQRLRKFDAATLAQTLVFGCLQNPRARSAELAQMAAICGVSVTPQAIDQRFNWALVDFLRQLLQATVQQVVAAPAISIPLLQRFNGVYVHDSTTIALPDELAPAFPGCGGNGSAAALKVQTRLNLTTGELQYVGLEPGRCPDQGSAIQDTPLPAGALRLADLGYFDIATLLMLARMQVYWISRIQSGTAVSDAQGNRLDLHSWLATHASDGPVEISIQLGAKERFPCRLVAFPAPPEVVSRRRQNLRKEATRKGRTPSRERLEWCRWTVFVTNVEPERLTIKEIIVLYRARWQIELLFKLWKSHGLVAITTSHQPARRAAEIFARLLAVVLQHWFLLASVWSYGDRSLVKAARAVRPFVAGLAAALHSRTMFERILQTLCASVARIARIDTRKRKPSCYQLLLNPDLLQYALT